MQLNHLHIATSVVVGFALVAVAVFLKLSTPAVDSSTKNSTNSVDTKQFELKPEEIKRVNNRNLYGNEDAEITIVEFSDFECPFCARLHPTLKQIVDESDGKIVWEFRHLPLPMHQNAITAAVSSECVAEQLGADSFWNYTDALFKNVGNINADFLKQSALELGFDSNGYDECMESDEVLQRVVNDSDTARKLGGSGTPFSIIINENQMIPMVGALPYEEWQKKLEF